MAASAFVLASLGQANVAMAQLASSRSGSSTLQVIEGSQIYVDIAAFGRCYAQTFPANALRLMATEPGSREEVAFFQRMFRQEQSCLTDLSYMRTSQGMIRGAIAEGLYERHVAIPASLWLPAPAAGAPIRTISEAARCYTATDRGSVMRLLQTRPGGREETAAIQALMPEFSRCVPPGASNYRISSTQLRLKLAEALLRLPPPGAAPGAAPTQ